MARGLWRRPDDSDEPYRDGHRWEGLDDGGEADPAASVDEDSEENDDADLAEAKITTTTTAAPVDDVDDATGGGAGDDEVSGGPAEARPPT